MRKVAFRRWRGLDVASDAKLGYFLQLLFAVPNIAELKRSKALEMAFFQDSSSFCDDAPCGEHYGSCRLSSL